MHKSTNEGDGTTGGAAAGGGGGGGDGGSAARAHAKVLRSVKTSGVRGMLTGLKRYVEGSDWKHRSVLLQGQ